MRREPETGTLGDEEMARIAKGLWEASAKVNASRNRLRMVLQGIAGCSLEDWTMKDLMQYAKLFEEKYGKRNEDLDR